MYDYILIGAGLAGKLSALYFASLSSQSRVLLIEQQSTLNQSHTWSCFSSDVPDNMTQFSKTLPWTIWNQHEVHFPHLHRTLQIGYQSIKEKDLNHLVINSPQITLYLNSTVVESDFTSEIKRVKIHKDGDQIISLTGKRIYDCTGWQLKSKVQSGFQKFIGLELCTSDPHGIKNPIIMDACVEQSDGYRFFYVLPFSDYHIFIEDTYYSATSNLDEPKIEHEIHDYLKRKTGLVGKVVYREIGCLPIPLDLISQKNTSSMPAIGAAGSHFHRVTGYSLPAIFQQLAQISNHSQITMREKKIYILLNRFLFLAASQSQRWQVFQFFYQHSESLIQKFYSGHMTILDWIQFFCKWPPPVNALKAIFIAGRFVKEMTFRPSSEKL